MNRKAFPGTTCLLALSLCNGVDAQSVGSPDTRQPPQVREWFKVGTISNPSGAVVVFIDTLSAKTVSDRIVSIWVRLDVLIPPNSEYPEQHLTLRELNCPESLARVIGVTDRPKEAPTGARSEGWHSQTSIEKAICSALTKR